MTMNSKSIITIIVGLVLTQSVFADGVAQSVDGLETDVDALESGVSTLEGQVATLETNNAALEAVIVQQTALITSLTEVVDGLVEQQRCHQNATQNVDWSGCTFVWLDLWNEQSTDFVENNLFNANLSYATFTNSNFIFVIGMYANLEGTTFDNVNLAYGDWTGANIVTNAEALAAGNPESETIFINTNCPDEFYIVDSRTSGDTCEGHLSP